VKSTGIFGISQVINIAIGFARSKILAICLGPVGIGILGIYQTLQDTIRSFTGLGIDSGGLREIAACNARNNREELVTTISVVGWWIIRTGFFAAAVCLLFCYPISLLAFDKPDYWWEIALLSVALFLTLYNIGQTIILQGLRKITWMVRAGIFANFAGLVLSVPFYFLLGLHSIFLSFIICGACSAVIFASYTRKLKLKTIKISPALAWKRGKEMLKLGIYVSLAGIASTAAMFLIRSYLVHSSSLSDAGLFQAVWTICNIYLMLILRSMGADFYPRLCGIIEDKKQVSELINEQTYIAMALALPIVVLMMALAQWVLVFLYSTDFAAATLMFRWQIAGTFLKILSWPLGYIMLAKNKGRHFIICEISFYAVYLAAVYVLYPLIGFNALGIGYLLAYIEYLVAVYFVGWQLVDARWKGVVWQMLAVGLFFIASIFAAMYLCNGVSKYFVCGALCLSSILFSLYKLNQALNLRQLAAKLKRKRQR
jgi:PST family polysaccharide transporter